MSITHYYKLKIIHKTLCSVPRAVVDMAPVDFNGAESLVTYIWRGLRNLLCTIVNLKTLVRLKVAVGTMFLRECA